jgi:uncharacterized protein (TIGR03000 family)
MALGVAVESTLPPPPPPPADHPAVEIQPGLLSGTGYRLLRRLGRGAFGEVWHAEAPGGLDAAVKIIFRSLTEKEAQTERNALELTKKLHHGYLLQTHAFWAMADRLIIVMELVDGSLRDRYRECVAAGLVGIPVEELLPYVKQAASALDYLHDNRLLHRDVKPENVLRLGKIAKVGDFGLAVLLPETVRSVTVTSAGTVPYMGPEVWYGKACEASDQWSLAVTYAELRTGRPLFGGPNHAELMFAILNKEPDLSGLRHQEQTVLRRALAKDYHDRFPTCSEFAAKLEQALKEDAQAGRAPEATTGSFLQQQETAGRDGAIGGWKQVAVGTARQRWRNAALAFLLTSLVLGLVCLGFLLGCLQVPGQPAVINPEEPPGDAMAPQARAGDAMAPRERPGAPAPPPDSAEKSSVPAAVDRYMYDSLRFIINHGVEAYNAGRVEECYEHYRRSLQELAPALSHHPDLQKLTKDGLDKVEKDPDWCVKMAARATMPNPQDAPPLRQKAFALRALMNDVRAGLAPAAGPGAAAEQLALPAGTSPPNSTEKGSMTLPAWLRVKVPADARLEIGGRLMQQAGEARAFVTPLLSVNATVKYNYTLKATFKDKEGKEVTVEDTVQLTPGKTTEVDLTKPRQ